MKKVFGYKLITAFIFVLALIAVLTAVLKGAGGITASADTAFSKAIYDDGYITADVDENKVLHVTEELNVGFGTESGEFERQIPAIGKTADGRRYIISIENFRARIDGAEAETWISREGSIHFAKVMSPARFLKWEYEKQNTYQITLSYDYVCSDDVDGTNALWFDLGGFNEEWFIHETQKDPARLYVTVNMPKDFDASQAAVFAENKNANEESGFKAEGRQITFSAPYSGVNAYSLRVNLPENYFSAKITQYNFYWIFVALFAIIVCAGIWLTVKYRPRKPLVTVEFEPPLLNPMHFSAFWHGYARRRDICTVVLQWANQGCVKIKKDGRHDLIITKIKELPESATEAERGYFKALFEEGDDYRSAEMRGRAKRDHRNSIRYAAGKLIDEFGEPVTYAKGVERTRFFVRYIPVFTFVVVFAYFIVLSRFYAGITFLFMATVAMIGFMKIVSTVSEETKGERHRRLLLFGLSLGLGSSFPVVFGLVMYFAAADTFLPMYDYIYLTYIAIAWVLISIAVLPKFIGKRTEEAQALYGKMLGFKNFLEKAEVKQMEALLEENPEYYLNVLPYCMIMGLSKKLDKKTEFLQSPDWADGFEAKRFASSLFSAVKHSVITRKKKVKNEEE